MLEHGFARPTVSSFPGFFHACRLRRQAWKKRNILAEWSKTLNSRHSERSEESSLGRDSGKILRCYENREVPRLRFGLLFSSSLGAAAP